MQCNASDDFQRAVTYCEPAPRHHAVRNTEKKPVPAHENVEFVCLPGGEMQKSDFPRHRGHTGRMNKNRKDETIPSVYGALLLAMVEGFEFFVYGPLFLALLEGLGFLLFGWLPAPYGGFGAMIVALIVMAVISAFGLVWALALLWDQRKSGAYRLAWILIGAIIHAGVSLSVFSMFSA